MERRHWNHSTYPTTSSTSYDHATTRSSGSTTELSSTSSQGDSGGTGQGSTEVTSISAPAPTLSSSSRRSLSSTLSSMAQSSISAPSSSIASLSNGTIGGFQDKLVVGQRGFDAASAGMVSTAILGFIVAGGLLVRTASLSLFYSLYSANTNLYENEKSTSSTYYQNLVTNKNW